MRDLCPASNMIVATCSMMLVQSFTLQWYRMLRVLTMYLISTVYGTCTLPYIYHIYAIYIPYLITKWYKYILNEYNNLSGDYT